MVNCSFLMVWRKPVKVIDGEVTGKAEGGVNYDRAGERKEQEG